MCISKILDRPIQTMITANDRKVLCQLLGNLDIAAPVDDRTLHKLHLFLSNLQQVKLFVSSAIGAANGH